MVENQRSDNLFYSLQILRRNDDDIRKYAEFSQNYVLEGDKKTIENEVKRIKTRFHIDHCWIVQNDNKIGIVKIIRNTFYGLGLPENLQKSEIDQILNTIENDITSFHHYKLEGTLHSKYVPLALERNYQVAFSRKKMELKLSKAKNLVDYSDVIIKEYDKKSIEHLVQVFIEAYAGSVDEKVGMFDRNIAHSAVRSIMDGEFGKFAPKLSGMLFNQSGKKLIAGVLITLLEDKPFVVIIGVERSFQGMKYGRKIMSWAIDQALKHNFTDMRLWVTLENITALKLYQSLGFTELLSISSVVKLL